MIDQSVPDKKSSKRTLKQSLKAHSLFQLLPYESYEESTSLFYNKKSVGFVINMHPLTSADNNVAMTLNAILSDVIPAGTDLQILLWGSNKIGNQINRWSSVRKKNHAVHQLAKKRRNYFKNKSYNCVDGSDVFRDFHLLISVSQVQSAQNEIQTQSLIKLRQSLITSIHSIGGHAKNIEIKYFISLINNLLYPSSEFSLVDSYWSPLINLSQHFINPAAHHNISDSHIDVNSDDEAWQITCFTVQQYPNENWAIWGNQELIGDMFRQAIQIPTPFCLSCVVHIPENEIEQARVELKSARAEQLVRSPIAKFIPIAKRAHAEWQYAKERLAVKDRLVYCGYQVILYSPKELAEFSETKVKDLFRVNGWRIIKERYIHYAIWLATLPMMLSEGMFDDLKKMGRLKTMPTQSVTHLLPLFAEWKGLASPYLLLVGRRGQTFFWDNFNDQGDINSNYNVCVVASPGAGKSVTINEKVMTEVSHNGRVWVIDVGRSYERLCHYLDGEFIEFKSSSNIQLNPFSSVNDLNESLQLLKPLLALMARPNVATSDEENAYLEKAISSAWQEFGNETTITKVADKLASYPDSVSKNLSHLLYPYTEKGMYGGYFNKPANLNMDNPLIVLELEELKSKQDLQQVILWVLMQHITEVMYQTDRSIRKSVIIDEAWDLMKGENVRARQFIEAICRRARKYRGCLITISQSTREYFSNSAAQAAWQLSDWRIFLKQNPDSIESMKKMNDICMDPYMERLLKDLRRTDNYSEMLIYGQGRYALGRLFLDPFSRVLYSSKGTEYEAVKQHINTGMTLSESIEAVLNDNKDIR